MKEYDNYQILHEVLLINEKKWSEYSPKEREKIHKVSVAGGKVGAVIGAGKYALAGGYTGGVALIAAKMLKRHPELRKNIPSMGKLTAIIAAGLALGITGGALWGYVKGRVMGHYTGRSAVKKGL